MTDLTDPIFVTQLADNNAATLRALSAALQEALSDNEETYICGMAEGQRALRMIEGPLEMIDGPEMLLLRHQLRQFRAETAAVIERAAQIADRASHTHGAMIRALTTPDQSAALAAVKAEVRADGMREAVWIVLSMQGAPNTCDAERDIMCAAADAIIAAIPEAKP